MQATKIGDGEVISGEVMAPGVVKGEGPPPLRANGRGVRTGKFHVGLVLALGRGEWLVAKLDELGIKVSSVKGTVVRANRHLTNGEMYHYEAWQSAENRMIVACADGPPIRRWR
jgi:hypothetical protein